MKTIHQVHVLYQLNELTTLKVEFVTIYTPIGNPVGHHKINLEHKEVKTWLKLFVLVDV